MEAIRFFQKNKRFFIYFTLAFMLLASALNLLVDVNRRSMVLTISYDETNKGLNPDKTRFNMFEIRSDEVISRAIQLSGLQNYVVSDLKSRINITPIIPSAVEERVRAAVESGTEYSYIPNEFTITYTQKNKMEKNHTLAFLNGLSQAYEEIFLRKYVVTNTILQVGNTNYDGYEYIEIADFYQDKIKSMMSYIQAQSANNGTYRSASTSLTFGDLYALLHNLNTIDVEKFKMYVIASGLSKDKVSYVNKLEYLIDRETTNLQKAEQAVSVTQEAIQSYDAKITGVIFVPSVDVNREYYMSRTKTGIDYLTTNAYNRGLDAKGSQSIIDYNNYLMGAFQGGPADEESYNQVQGEAGTMLTTIQSKLNEISQLAITTDNEFIEYKTGNYIQFAIPEAGVWKLIRWQGILFNLVVGAFLALVLLYLAYFYKKNIHFKDWKKAWRKAKIEH